ncbi:RNA polymerase sigma factor [Pedobacter jeongneungensis]|uniref:RNA polymerase sigma factor n=1 Tax=Pedobacter jeongneungensis TaxID=947309 RepID=UPI0004692F73|nr:RNA polymerase sigma-70 factor [Pedobacter jeongneungensis]
MKRNDHKELSDLQLVSLIKEGDHISFANVFDRHWHSLYVHALKMLGNEEEAKDMVQEVFTSLWKQGDQLSIHTTLKAYLFSAVRHRVLNEIRANDRRSQYYDRFALYLQTHQTSVIEKIQFQELEQAIDKVISNLPERMREVFEMSRKQSMTNKEIALKMNIAETTVKRQISNAILILKNHLSKSYGSLFILSYLFLGFLLKYISSK